MCLKLFCDRNLIRSCVEAGKMTNIWNHIQKHPHLWGSRFWSLLLKGACELLCSLIKPDGLDDSWLDSWLTAPTSIYSQKYVDEPETISFRKSTSLNIFRKLNFYGWPSLWAAKMSKSVSCGTRMFRLSAGELWTRLLLQMCAKTTATTNYRPISHFGGREEHVRVIGVSRDVGSFLQSLPLPLLAPFDGVTFCWNWFPVYLLLLISNIWGWENEVDTPRTCKYIKTCLQTRAHKYSYICPCINAYAHLYQ